MKVVFLDIDGVLNSRSYITKMGELWDDPQHQIDPAAVIRLNRLTDATGASIVVSSTWRLAFRYYLDKLQACMASYGITAPVVGMTPDFVVPTDGQVLLATGTRGDEITAWLDDNNVIRFVILDDESVPGLSNYLIKTTFDDGLQDDHVDRAIALLGRK